jgi:dihydrofolate synthase/folylpolyglutamate synthase
MDPPGGPAHVSDAARWPATAALFARQRFGVAPGLDRTRTLLDRLGRPQDAFDAVLIGGTNGKGGTVAHLAAMLAADAAARGRVGRTTSPHLTDPGERIVIDERPLAPEAFEALAADVTPHADALQATFFEVVTAMAVLAFARAGVGRAVVEVGLGGRLDATNVLEPVASGVAQVALDHQAILGPDLRAIAREKAGILRPGRPAWTSAEGAGGDALDAAARAAGVALARLDRDARVERCDLGWDGSALTLQHPGRGTLAFRTPLVGAAQARNAALAALLAQEVGASDAAIARGAERTRWPGRLEVLAPTPASPEAVARAPGRLILDGAHNPAAATALAATLRTLRTRPAAVVGLARDKDAQGVLAALAPVVSGVRLTRALASPRAQAPGLLAQVARAEGLRVDGVHDDPREALEAALAEAAAARSERDRDVLVAGSLYLIGELRPWALGRPVPAWERWQ